MVDFKMIIANILKSHITKSYAYRHKMLHCQNACTGIDKPSWTLRP